MKTILTLICGLIVCVNLASLLTGVIPVDWVPLWQLVPVFDLALLALAIGLWVFTRIRPYQSLWPLISVVFSGIVVVMHVGFTLPSFSTPSGSAYKLVSINVGQFHNDTSEVKACIERIKELDASFVLIQEFGLYHKWPRVDVVASDFAARCGYAFHEFSPHKENIFGTMLLSRFPILETDTVFQLRSETNEAKQYRFAIDGNELSVINAHVMSFNLAGEINPFHLKRLSNVIQKQAVQVDQIMSRNADLLVGDFNFVPGSHLYQELLTAYRPVFEGGLSPTLRTLPIRLDHAFYSNRLAIGDKTLARGFPGDHHALVFTFYILP